MSHGKAVQVQTNEDSVDLGKEELEDTAERFYKKNAETIATSFKNELVEQGLNNEGVYLAANSEKNSLHNSHIHEKLLVPKYSTAMFDRGPRNRD